MPINITQAVIEAAILGFEEQKRRIDLQIAELRGTSSGEAETTTIEVASTSKAPRKKFSAATRRAMALAQQKRWAAKKGLTEPSATIAVVAPKAARKKGSMSPAKKSAMIAKLKKYWADKRAAKKAA